MICSRLAAGLTVVSAAMLLLSLPAKGIPRRPARAQDVKINQLLADASNAAQISRAVGVEPHRCLDSSSSVEVCEWRLGARDRRWDDLARAIGTQKRIAVICALPKDGSARLRSSCVARPRGSNRTMFSTRKYRSAKNFDEADVRAHFGRLAQEWIDESLTMVSLSFLLGGVPSECSPPVEGRQACAWRLDDSQYGHGTVSAAVGARGNRRVRLDCRLPADGTPRAVEACVASIEE